VPGDASLIKMPTRILLYVAAVTLAAFAALVLLWRGGDPIQAEHAWAALGLVMLGAYTAFTKYKTSRNSSGEVSFIPYITAIVLYPHWSTVCFIGLAVSAIEIGKKKHPLKQVFNSSQYILASTAATAAYSSLGGVPLVVDSSFALVPHAIGVLTFLFINSLAVAGVVALLERKSVLGTFIEINRSSLFYDLFAIPGVYGVARAYTDWSWWGLVITVLLLYGVRLMYQARLQLENTNRELLELFVHTVEFRDPYTSGHSQRVARYSKIIARAVGLSAKEVQRIGRAALLHDVGKIHEVFAPILSKPGKLTPEERALMELHPVKSAELVAKLSDFEDIVADVRHHHERFDGMGYPDRLVGKKIPLGSRIIAFADTIDAMTTDRPYRRGMSPEEVKEELLRCSGDQFDPDICDALLKSPIYTQLFDGSDADPVLSMTQVLSRVKRNRTPVPV
jgi:HD-GYP domain-containing protein (c-di-GMP phosphodiesterase class II)